MSNINTELNEAVSKGTNLSDAWNELMRKELEHAINELLQSELTSFWITRNGILQGIIPAIQETDPMLGR